MSSWRFTLQGVAAIMELEGNRMPIYMDRHDLRGLTAEDVAEAHRRDIDIQDRHGVVKRMAKSPTPSFQSILPPSRRSSAALAIRAWRAALSRPQRIPHCEPSCSPTSLVRQR